MENELATVTEKRPSLVQAFDITNENLPDLHQDSKEVPADLTAEYWTPENEGEFKLCFYQRIEPSIYQNPAGDEISLPCAILIAQNEDKSLVTIRNGSKRLVASLEEAESSGQIEPGTPLKITYKGKEKNKTNSYMSDRWSVRPLSAKTA